MVLDTGREASDDADQDFRTGVGHTTVHLPMRDENSDLQASGSMTRVGRIVAALVGLLAAAGCLITLIFLLSGRRVVDFDIVFSCFLACASGAGFGFFFL